MYYVIKGETTCFAARGPKELRADLKKHETMDIRTFDYDDTIIWIDDALKFETRRVKDDPYAMAALDAERDRRSDAGTGRIHVLQLLSRRDRPNDPENSKPERISKFVIIAHEKEMSGWGMVTNRGRREDWPMRCDEPVSKAGAEYKPDEY